MNKATGISNSPDGKFAGRSVRTIYLAANFAKVHSKATRYELYIGPLGHLLFLVLTAMAAWFWQERTLILDAAFQSYLFIADSAPTIMVERFGAAAVQLLPLAGVWAGAALPTVLLLYSVSIVLFHWVLFSVCLYGLKDKKSALAILLFNLLLVGDSFYWMQNELLQAVSYMFVLWSLWMRRTDLNHFSRRDAVMGIVLATTVIYNHPLVFFPLSYMWCWLWLHPARLLTKRTLVAIAALFALIFASKYLLREPNFYDRGMTGQYVREFRFSAERLLHSRSFNDFTAHLDDNLLLLLPLLAAVTAFYLARRQFALALLAPGAVLLYCLLIMQRFLDDDRWYIQESHYQALAVFLIVPLVWDLLPALASRRYGSLWLLGGGLLVILRLWGIWDTHTSYSARLAYVRELLKQTESAGGRKMVLGYDQADRKILMMYWGLPYESLQISALASPDSTRVLAIAENPDSLARRLSPDSMTTFLMIPAKAFDDLPAGYYKMHGDTSAYRVVRFK